MPMSPSSRRVWIEIWYGSSISMRFAVALLAEGVDRNHNISNYAFVRNIVALLAEGVDRNTNHV